MQDDMAEWVNAGHSQQTSFSGGRTAKLLFAVLLTFFVTGLPYVIYTISSQQQAREAEERERQKRIAVEMEKTRKAIERGEGGPAIRALFGAD